MTDNLMFREKCLVKENVKVAPGHFVLKFFSPKISKNARPGQFIQITCVDSYEPLLPRPFSFLTATARDFSVLYHVVGKGTEILSKAKKGDALWVLGPLGNGWSLRGGPQGRRSNPSAKIASGTACPRNDVVLVGGGVGIPPLYHLAQKLPKASTHVLLGARNKSLLLCENDFKKLKVDLRVATDDGSKGHKGFVTELLNEFLVPGVQIYTCGPTLMLKAVSALALKYGVSCEVSVEVPMACGFGACLGCAVKLTLNSELQAPNYRYAIACCEGPVFQAKDLVWD